MSSHFPQLPCPILSHRHVAWQKYAFYWMLFWGIILSCFAGDYESYPEPITEFQSSLWNMKNILLLALSYHLHISLSACPIISSAYITIISLSYHYHIICIYHYLLALSYHLHISLSACPIISSAYITIFLLLFLFPDSLHCNNLSHFYSSKPCVL